MALSVAAIASKAQTTFLGGNIGFAYTNEVFSMTILPQIGYEFNDKVAIGAGAGVSVYDGESSDIFDPYLRFNIWNNESVFFDVKARDLITVYDGVSEQLVGLCPALRVRLSEKWELDTDFLGTFGAYIYDGDASAAISLKNVNVNATIIYRF